MKPSGKYVMEDVQNIGGTPALMKYLVEKGLMDDSQMTVTGLSIAKVQKHMHLRTMCVCVCVCVLMKYLVEKGLMDDSQMTVTGLSIAKVQKHMHLRTIYVGFFFLKYLVTGQTITKV